MAKTRHYLDGIETTNDIPVPQDILDQVIGQDAAVKKVKLAIKQRRHLLLVGPPGIGKSMLAMALALHLPKPTQQINVVHNPKNPQKPLVEVITKDVRERFITPKEAPSFVSEQLGFKCPKCGAYGQPSETVCGKCKSEKFEHVTKKDVVHTTCFGTDGREVDVVYERVGDRIKTLDHAVERVDVSMQKIRHTIVPLDRSTFVHATGASETELLGDVRHDPYGSHPEIGTPAYLRVVPGAVHEAHEGVLFIDELPHLASLQNFILTAMQEKKFPITGRNPQSAGASVKVNDVPCDFLFVGACNIREISGILPPLRSRIAGNGYEILLDTSMPDTEENRMLMTRFVAQEILSDGRIPHAKKEVIVELIAEARRRARELDNVKDSLTLRLRDLSGAIRMAGDFAVEEGSGFIERRHIKRSIVESRSIEHQLKERYGSLWEGLQKDSVNELEVRGDNSYL